MKFWLPFTEGNSGSDISIRQLALALDKLGHTAVVTTFPHYYQYMPWLLKFKATPDNIDCIIGNSWNAFAFKRPAIPLITVERLFVLDKEYAPYKSVAQTIFHNFFLKHWLKLSYKNADSIVALSQSTAVGIRSVFTWAKPYVIMNAVDINYFKPMTSPVIGKTNTSLKLLYVGNISKRKGTDLLIPIIDKLGDSVHLFYTADRSTNTIDDHINTTCLGRLNLSEVKQAYQDADLLILPTRLEGLPRAAMESIACGTPVISSDASSLPEIVINAITGYVCKKDNINSFVETINKLINNKKEIEELSYTSRQYAEENLDLKVMAEKYIVLAASLVKVNKND